MGLDMYLYAEQYVGGYEWGSEDERKKYDQVVAVLPPGIGATDESKHVLVRVPVAYWRKANAVHQWFVEQAQDGTDDCGYHYVTRDQIQELVETVQDALAAYRSGDKDKAKEILPPQGGFFFGSTEVNEWYEEDLVNTIKQLAPLLATDGSTDVDFYYHSSW